jgi:hypothetical protein
MGGVSPLNAKPGPQSNLNTTVNGALMSGRSPIDNKMKENTLGSGSIGTHRKGGNESGIDISVNAGATSIMK